MLENGKYYLITADNWFIGTDGEQYKSAWGKIELCETKETLGFTPQRPSTNWFAKIGTEDNHVIIAGCQIHYAVRCEKRPAMIEGKLKDAQGYETINNRIFFTE